MKTLNKLKKTLSYLFSFDAEELESFANSQEKRFEGIFEKTHFSSYLPYRFYDQEKGLFINHSSFGFCFQFSPLLGASSLEKEELEDLIEKLFWEGGSCQFLLFADPFVGDWMDHWSSLKKGSPEVFHTLFSKRKAFYRAENLSASPEGIIPLRKFSVFFSYSVPKKADEPTEALIKKLQAHKKYAESMLRRIAGGKECVAEMGSESLIKLVSHLTGMELTTHSPAPKSYAPFKPINEQIATGGAISTCSQGCVFHGEHDDMFFKMLELHEAPPSWDFRGNLELIGGSRSDEYRIQTPFFLHYGIHYPSQLANNATIAAKEKLVRKQMSTLSFLRKNPEMIKETTQYCEAMRQFDRGGKYLTTRFNVGIWGNKERFKEAIDGITSLYKSNGLLLKEPRFVHLDDFLRSLPMVWGEAETFQFLKNTRTVQTTMTGKAAHFCPILADFSGTSLKGIPLISRRGQLTFFDPFSAIKAHTSIIGPTGTGKSVFLNELFFQSRAKDARVFVIDKGGSFRNLCDLLDGQYIDISPKQSLNLNPFSFMPTDAMRDEAKDMMEALKAIIRTIYQPTGKINERELTFLDQATEYAFGKKGNDAVIDDIIEAISSELTFQTDLNNSAKEYMVQRLFPFSRRGSFARYLYGTDKLDFQGDFTVIETNQMGGFGEFKNVVLQTFFLRTLKEIYEGDRSREKIFAIDECHNLIGEARWAHAIQMGTREFRKFKTAMILATQNISDFKGNSKEAEAAFLNCEWLINLGDGKGTIDTIEKSNLLKLADYEKELFCGLTKSESFSEVAIRSTSQNLTSLYRFRLDPFSLKLFSTKGNDYERFQFLHREGYTIESTISWLVSLEKEFAAFDKQKVASITPREHITRLLQEKKNATLLQTKKKEKA